MLLMVAGLLYAWYGLIPLLLDYLTTDAQQAGLSTEWRLSNYAGFIVNLLSASAIGFQAPLLTTLVLRSGVATHQQLAASTTHHLVWCLRVGCLHVAPGPVVVVPRSDAHHSLV